MAIASLRVPISPLPKPDLSWLDGLSEAGSQVADELGQRKSFNSLADRIGGGAPTQQQGGGFLSRLIGTSQPQQAQPRLAATARPGMPSGSLPSSFVTAVDRTEGAGGYDTLYGHAQKNGPFAGTSVSGMPIKDVIAFTDPSGAYAQSVKNQIGRVATPVGRYQVVGTTLRNAVNELGLDPNAPFDQNAQDQIGAHLARRRIASADTIGGKINALRQEWHGFKNVPDAEMAQIVQDLESGATGPAASAQPSSLPNEVASLDPSIGIPMPGAAGQIRAGAPAQRVDPGAAPYVDPQVTTAYQDQPSIQPPMAPSGPQVADNSGSIIAPGITPIQQGGVDPQTIQFLLRDPNLREVGLKLWAANVQGQEQSEPWQFVTLPDGTLARANQQTGEVTSLGQFSKPAEPKALINLGDGRLFDPNNREVIDAGGNRAKAPNIVELFDEQTGQPYKARWDEEKGAFERVGGTKAPSGGLAVTTNPDGTTTVTMGGAKPPKLTEAEGKNAGFLVRANDSQKTLNDLEAQGSSLWNNTAGKIPLVGNFLRSEEAQKYDQAKRDFINAQLRRESGAVISPEEFANAEQQYFPQPGDGPEVIKQKRANRQNAIRGLEIGSGAGADLATQPRQQPTTNRTSTGVQWSIEE